MGNHKECESIVYSRLLSWRHMLTTWFYLIYSMPERFVTWIFHSELADHLWSTTGSTTITRNCLAGIQMHSGMRCQWAHGKREHFAMLIQVLFLGLPSLSGNRTRLYTVSNRLMEVWPGTFLVCLFGSSKVALMLIFTWIIQVDARNGLGILLARLTLHHPHLIFSILMA